MPGTRPACGRTGGGRVSHPHRRRSRRCCGAGLLPSVLAAPCGQPGQTPAAGAEHRDPHGLRLLPGEVQPQAQHSPWGWGLRPGHHGRLPGARPAPPRRAPRQGGRTEGTPLPWSSGPRPADTLLPLGWTRLRLRPPSRAACGQSAAPTDTPRGTRLRAGDGGTRRGRWRLGVWERPPPRNHEADVHVREGVSTGPGPAHRPPEPRWGPAPLSDGFRARASHAALRCGAPPGRETRGH